MRYCFKRYTFYIFVGIILLFLYFQIYDRNQQLINIKLIKFKNANNEDGIYNRITNTNLEAPNKHNSVEDLPGEMGKPVFLDENNLTKVEMDKLYLGWQNYGFNEYVSNMIRINRQIPKVLDKECLDYSYNKTLPQTSVIICFYNEAWSVLLRSVNSVIKRSPKHLLKEVILIDDFSTMEHLHNPLEDYMSMFPIVKIIRAKKREGLIRARLLGARYASAEVLTFLDSHIECTEGWLEPLLDPISQHWANVTVPRIENINARTFEYKHFILSFTQVGEFNWGLQYRWEFIPEKDKIGRKSTDPVNSPAMSGGLFSISKKFFEYLGGYDPEYEIWGGENLELSFKIWMCGGILKVIPCSQVGHIFRARSPYPLGNGFKRNLVRLAEVWMDEYKDFYYKTINYDLGNYGDVSERKTLRKNLNCKTFKWYIETIYPQIVLPFNAAYSGNIVNEETSKCLIDDNNKHIIVKEYRNNVICQHLVMFKTGELRLDNLCLGYDSKVLQVVSCHIQLSNQHWNYTENRTICQMIQNLCLEIKEDNKLIMTACSDSPRQKWIFKRY